MSPIALHVCILSCATAPRPGCCPRFCVPILPPQQRVVQRCLTRGTVISRPVVWGPIGLALPRSRSPCSPPGHFATFRVRHRPLCRLTNPISQEQHWGPAGNRPLPRAHTGDPIPITPVKGTYLGEIESFNRNVRSCECVVNCQQINYENSITGYTFSKLVTCSKPVNRLTGFPLNKPNCDNKKNN